MNDDFDDNPAARARALEIALGAVPRDEEPITVGELFPPPSDPMAVARRFLIDVLTDGLLTLRWWRGGWMRWEQSHWIEGEERELRSLIYRRLEHAYWQKTLRLKNGESVTIDIPWEPNKRKVADVVEALAACVHLAESVDPPAWLRETHAPFPAAEIVGCANGLLHVGTRKLLPLTPAYFNRVAVPFAYDAAAPEPTRWLTFLHELWPDDEDSIAALQEFFGYVLSGRTDLQKILLLIGPIRSGKGTIARVLEALVGKGNAAGPTLASLGTNFGLSPLLGKPLAVVSDARLAGTNVSTVVERLLSISGEDMLTVDRKYREPWTGKLPSRFIILSNELPRFGDASGAIATRFIVLQLTESFLGKENTRLTNELLTELPGILGWSLDGLDRLTRRGAINTPASSADAISALQDLVSPVAAFVRDRCQTGPTHEEDVTVLHQAWRVWCEDNSHRVTSVQTFGRDVRAVVAGIKVTQPRDGGTRVRRWSGIRLRPSETDNTTTRVPPRATTLLGEPARDGTRTSDRGANTNTCRECGEPLDGPAGMFRCESNHTEPKKPVPS